MAALWEAERVMKEHYDFHTFTLSMKNKEINDLLLRIEYYKEKLKDSKYHTDQAPLMTRLLENDQFDQLTELCLDHQLCDMRSEVADSKKRLESTNFFLNEAWRMNKLLAKDKKDELRRMHEHLEIERGLMAVERESFLAQRETWEEAGAMVSPK
jgi:hypothetical protein